jgi:hypothetical protein
LFFSGALVLCVRSRIPLPRFPEEEVLIPASPRCVRGIPTTCPAPWSGRS